MYGVECWIYQNIQHKYAIQVFKFSAHRFVYDFRLWMYGVRSNGNGNSKILYKQTISFRVHAFSINLKVLLDFGSFRNSFVCPISCRWDTKVTKALCAARVVDMCKKHIFRHRLSPFSAPFIARLKEFLVPLVLDFYSIFSYFICRFWYFFFFFFFSRLRILCVRH